MLTSSQLKTMLTLQAAMNAKVNPAWLTAGYPFLRAVVVEGAEAMEHHGWKWWKKQAMDLPQLQMELIDIWHFALSHFLVRAKGDIATAIEMIKFDGQNGEAGGATTNRLYLARPSGEFHVVELDSLDIIGKLELMIGLAAMGSFRTLLFLALLTDCHISTEELYRQYVCKNVLNFFRQDHGYKEGTYRKVWAGREDNEHLVEIASALDAAAANFSDRLYSELSTRYQATAG